MILYKYMPFGSARAVIENSSIGFSCLEDLNDPFEGAALHFPATATLSSKAQHNPYWNNLSRKYGVLSMTRAPLNALMWAHYGDNHRGVVIGIDTVKARLESHETCLIPAQHGDLIYTSTIPRNEQSSSTDELFAIGQQHHYAEPACSLHKNAFLYKDRSWGYEEEVRVVKNVSGAKKSRFLDTERFSNPSGEWTKIIIEGRPLYCLAIPAEAIVSAYLGCQTYRNISRLGMDRDEYEAIRQDWKSRGISVKVIHRCDDSWGLKVSGFEV